VNAPLVQHAQARQAVDDVADRDAGRVADRGQVDRGVPGDQEPDVAVDRPPRVLGQGQADRREAGIQGTLVLGREGRKAVDARRERVRRAVQAPLLSVVPVRAVRAPLPASSYVTPRSDPDLPLPVRFAAGSPRAPRRPRSTRRSVRMPDVRGSRTPASMRLSTNPRRGRDSWTTPRSRRSRSGAGSTFLAE
jgi:hypothetical protein